MVLNSILRGATIASRFFLLIYISKFIGLDFVGEFSYYSSIVAILYHLIGFDFYTFSTREIIGANKGRIEEIINSHIVLIIFVYAFLFLIILSLYLVNLISIIIVIIYFITLVEHLSQEFFRILIAFESLLFANFLLFLKGGLWVFISVPIIHFIKVDNNMVFLLLFWLSGGLLSVMIGYFYLKNKYNGIGKLGRFNLFTIKQGIRQGLVYLVGSFSQRSIFSLDKIILQNFVSSSSLGVYSIFSSISSAIFSLIEMGIVNNYYPKMVLSYNRNDQDTFGYSRMKMNNGINLWFTIISIIILILGIIFFYMIGFYEHLKQIHVLVVLLFGIFLYLRCMDFLYLLYAMREDKLLQKPYFFGFVLFVIISIPMSFFYGIFGMSLALFVTYLFMFLFLKLVVIKMSLINKT